MTASDSRRFDDAASGSNDCDESARFCLPANAPLLANLAALWDVDPNLARELESVAARSDLTDWSYPIQTARDGLPTLARAVSGRTLQLHSRHQPMDEAKRLIEDIPVADRMTFYILGLGLGYHAEALWEKVSAESRLWVFEPDLRLLWTALYHRDLSAMIGSGRVIFFHRADKSDLFARLSPHSALISLGWETVAHGPSLQLHPDFFAQVQTWIAEFEAFSRTSMNTLVLNSTKTARNIAANIGWYAAGGSLARLKDAFAGKPAIIVSAGPSLRKNKHLLRGLRENAVLIAVQTALQPLLDIGVEPQFVTSLDYHEICSRFFEKLPPGIKTELVAEPKATQAIFRLNPGPLTMLGNDFAEGLVREMALRKPTLPAGATVAHLAYYLAEHMACDPIIFIGQDLAFSDGLCYAPGTSYEDVWRPELSRFCSVEMKQWEQIIRDKHILRKVPDQNGAAVYTEERLFTYLQQFERDFGKSHATIIDATEGGARKTGAAPMTLAAAIEQFCKQPLTQPVPQHDGLDWQLLAPCVQSLATRKSEAIEIERIGRQTLPLLREIVAHLDDQARVNRIIGKIDALRAEMDRHGRTYDMIMQLSQPTELKRFEDDRKLAASGASGADKQRWQVRRDIANVEAVTQAAQEFAMLMDQVIAQLQAQMQQLQRTAA